jgi:hypothetical protein
MLYILATDKSPKIYIDFTQVLFEVSGSSNLDNPEEFYQPVFQYICDNFYQVKDSIYQRSSPSLTLHFYINHLGQKDFEMLQKMDSFLSKVEEFKTYVFWYYKPDQIESVEQANKVKSSFSNYVRLIENSVF